MRETLTAGSSSAARRAEAPEDTETKDKGLNPMWNWHSGPKHHKNVRATTEYEISDAMSMEQG